MLKTRVIPTLLLSNQSLVKTVNFKKPVYVGDPCNTVRIFNELEVDELLFLDISASYEKRSPNLKVLKEIADECFMPLGYGGGITTFAEAKAIFDIGFEKVVINTHAASKPSLIKELSAHYGSQAVMVSIDVTKNFFGAYQIKTCAGRKKVKIDLLRWVKTVEAQGAGELLLTNIGHEGTWSGFDLELVRLVSDAVSIPVIAHGGAGSIQHINDVVRAGASAVALGSMVVFQKKGMGVLVNFPEKNELEEAVE
ncbi:MAG: AglZ/HisF2 family acetamidino modification protein [Legionellaceae bacterium]|nr:AglZ/HisF2 family acetamidino modification protein [Legionellaceae bacterium]